jgi:methyltransferase (TIGR00027 family)
MKRQMRVGEGMPEHMEAAANSMLGKYRPSETAMATAFMRALASHDEREEVKGADYLAEVFLTEDQRAILKDPKVRQWVMKNKIDPGAYEFMIVRTAFFDYAVQQALRTSVPQIVFLGAGYDTRPYRFKDLIQDTRIFELDAQPTQQRKKEILHQASVPIPEQVVFVPINFETDNLKDAMLGAGFSRDRKALFVWEGVTYYLSAKVVDSTLSFIRLNSPPGSSICFDYASLSPEALNNGGVKKIRERMKSRYSAEPTRFGITQGKLASFLSERGYDIVEHLTANEMQGKYLTLRDGSSIGMVPSLFCLVHASVSAQVH